MLSTDAEGVAGAAGHRVGFGVEEGGSCRREIAARIAERLEAAKAISVESCSTGTSHGLSSRITILSPCNFGFIVSQYTRTSRQNLPTCEPISNLKTA
jgi:hypothetical protein